MNTRQKYKELLNHPNWQKRRLKVLKRADWRCQLCGDKDTQLHCHHAYYLDDTMPWDYPKGAIIALCKECHKKQHPEKTQSKQIVMPCPKEEKPREDAKSVGMEISFHGDDILKLTKFWTDFKIKIQEERKLISAWVGAVAGIKIEDNKLFLGFPADQQFSKDFLEGSHKSFLVDTAKSINPDIHDVCLEMMRAK